MISAECRQEYMAALEQASVKGDTEDFMRFIGRLMEINSSQKQIFTSEEKIVFL